MFHRLLLLCCLCTVAKAQNDSKSPFHPQSQAVDLFLSRDFSTLLKDVENGLDFHYTQYGRTYPKNEDVFLPRYGQMGDYGQLLEEREQIITNIGETKLAGFEKDFLLIYLQSMVLMFVPEELPQVKERIANYLISYPESTYTKYVNEVLNVEFEPQKVAFGAGAHTGATLPFGSMNKIIPVTIPVGATLDLSVGRFVIKTIGTFTPRFKVKTPTTYGGIDYPRDSTFWTTSIHFNAGYSLVDNKKYRITPFAGIGKRDLLLGKTSHLKYTWNPMFGIDFDWKFSEFNGNADYYQVHQAEYDDTVFYLRTRLGYSPLKFSDPRFIGSQFSVVVEIGFYEKFARRVK